MSDGVDLSDLDSVSSLFNNDSPVGQPLLVRLSDVYPDPDQPRKVFDDEALKGLAESIKVRGVKQPISVQAKDENGKYRINHGERRWRASKLAKVREIPVFIDDSSTDYDQMAENLDREDLTATEIAEFIAKRLALKDSKKQIAERLGKSPSWVTNYNALNEMSEPVQVLWDKGAISDARVVMDLNKGIAKDPSLLESLGEHNEANPITREIVKSITSPTSTKAGDVPLVTKSNKETSVSDYDIALCVLTTASKALSKAVAEHLGKQPGKIKLDIPLSEILKRELSDWKK